jgi:dTDP-4-amino-4,6-dideoxygalactose transaminase
VSEIAASLDAALRGGQLTNQGPCVQRFEAALEDYLGVHCVGVASGTMGLYLAATAVAPGGRVLVPAYTFPATALAFQMRRSRIALTDVLETTWCLDSESIKKHADIGCVVPVNVYGCPPDIDAIAERSAERRVPVIYDSAHGLGSAHRGRRAGRFGVAEVFSLHTTKILPCGEGGVIATGDESLAREVAQRRNFGLRNGESHFAGTNGKMQEFSAILGLWGLARLDEWIAHRAQLVSRYRERLAPIPGLRVQQIHSHSTSCHTNFAIAVSANEFGLTRDELAEALLAEQIGSRAYFAPDLGRHPGIANEAEAFSVARARRISDEILCLPLASRQNPAEVEKISNCIETLYEHRFEVARALRTRQASA